MTSFYLYRHWSSASFCFLPKCFAHQCTWEKVFTSRETVLWSRSLLAHSGRRLFQSQEWRTACMFPVKAESSFFNQHVTVKCAVKGKSPRIAVYLTMSWPPHKDVLAPLSEIINVMNAMQTRLPAAASSVQNGASSRSAPSSLLTASSLGELLLVKLSSWFFFFLKNLVVKHL